METGQWNSINKKQNGLKQSKNNKSSTLPWNTIIINIMVKKQSGHESTSG